MSSAPRSSGAVHWGRVRRRAGSLLLAAIICLLFLSCKQRLQLPNSNFSWRVASGECQLGAGAGVSARNWSSLPFPLRVESYWPTRHDVQSSESPVSRATSRKIIASRSRWHADRQHLIALVKRHGRAQREQRSGGRKLRSVVYSCTYGGFCGGLADRLDGCIVMYFVALMSNRSFFIDWTKPTSLEKFYTSRTGGNSLDWRVSSVANDSVRHNLASSTRVYVQQRDDSPDCDKLVRMAAAADGPAVLRVTTNHAKACVVRILRHELGFEQAPPDAMGLAFRWLFRQTPLLADAVARFAAERSWDAERGTCLHIRHGGRMGADVPSDFRVDAIRHHDIEPFWSCARMAVAEASPKACRGHGRPSGGGDDGKGVRSWLVVSDDDQLLGEAVRRLPQPSSVVDTRSLGPVLHVDKLGHYRRTHSLAAIAHGELRVFVDHALLQRCRVLLASHSAFSLSAAGISTVIERLYLVNWRRGAKSLNEPPCTAVDPYKFW